MPRERLLTLIQTEAELSAILMRAFILRRMALMASGSGDVALIGSGHSAGTLRLKEFLARNGYPYSYLDLERDPSAQEMLDRFHVRLDEVPIVICPDDQVLRNPSNVELADCLGFNDMIDSEAYRDRMQPGGYAEYSRLLACLIRDVRKDLAAPKLPFVIGVMGIGGLSEDAKAPQSNFRQAEMAPCLLPEFKGRVVAVKTSPFWDEALEALKDRMDRLRANLDQQAKKESMTREQRQAADKN